MSIMTKVVAAGTAVTALAVGGAVALAVAGGTSPAAADAGATITASATSLPDDAPSASSDSASPTSSAAPVGIAPPAAEPDGTRLTEEQAVAVAIAQVPGASVQRVRMEPEHGALVWKVDLVADSAEHEIRIDASSGTIVRAEVDGEDVVGDDGGDSYDDHGNDDD